jgi:hypothetical protein
MNRFATVAKLAVPLFLIFANSSILSAQPDSLYRLPAGTRIRLTLDSEISTRFSSLNDTFFASVVKPVVIRDTVVLPAGTIVEGRISKVSRPGSGGQNGRLDVRFETLKISNETRPIDGVMISKVRADSSSSFRVLSVLGGAVAGAVAGAVSGSGSGALIGAGVGAGAGTGIALFKKGKHARIRKDEVIEIELRTAVMLPVLDY